MFKKKIGETNLTTAPIIFGGNVFGWTLDEKQSFAILDEFFALGFNAIDTANNYSYWVEGNAGTESEAIIGKWLKTRGNREQLVLATKVGGRNLIQDKPNTTKEHIVKEIEDSLRRLQTDYIDLYQTHYDDENTAVEETLSAYDHLIKEGKVRYIGASNITAVRLQESLDKSEKFNLPRYNTLQPEYNLYDHEKFEEFLLPVCENHNIAVIPYYSLASGFLTGKYASEEDLNKSVRGKDIKKYLTPKGKEILEALHLMSEKHQVSNAAIALNWLMNQKMVVAPIASATKSSHLQSFVEATKIQLSNEDLMLLTNAASHHR
ncbi:aldo/keto reductase [Vaginella massiliensis]|uniref:aldo/keto reductase n=1 Tax=Vaginella massiliensis TaxID=1816680 RepID=UPI000839386C|nr:aldo/keto reductase [Vaginella massiliensis]